MNLVSISLRNLRIRALSSTLTTLSILVGTGLLAALWLLIDETNKRYKQSTLGYKAVVGPKEGSPLALVLNTIFNLGVSPGVMPLSVYEEIHEHKLQYQNRPIRVRYAIPQTRGDSYHGYPIIGTTDEMFSKFERGPGNRLAFASGKQFEFSHADLMAFARDKAEDAKHEKEHHGTATQPGDGHHHDHHEDELPESQRVAVIGAAVQRVLGLGLDAKIVPTHGKADEVGAHVHEDAACKVIGILEATGTPLDNGIYVPLSVFLSIAEHIAIRPDQSADAGSVSLSSVIVEPRDLMGASYLRYVFQTRSDGQVAWSENEVRDLLQMVGNATDVLRVVALLVLAVASISVLVALYNTMNERRREIAIMRSLGARRSQIVRIILFEALLISATGGVLGVLGCHAAAYLGRGTVERMAGVSVDWANFSVLELWLILGVMALGGFAGILPALKGSRTQVAENLGPTS